MLHYIIVPELGEIQVTDGAVELASFYCQETATDWEVFDQNEPNDMPVAHLFDWQAAIQWVMNIDPASFQEVDNG